MTKTSDQEVIQADREAAAEYVFTMNYDKPEGRDRWEELGEGLPIVQAFASHRMTERAAIVAWLRRQEVYYSEIDEGYHANAVSDAADAIERGDHTTPENSHEQ